jgi:hypothetical protein
MKVKKILLLRKKYIFMIRREQKRVGKERREKKRRERWRRETQPASAGN